MLLRTVEGQELSKETSQEAIVAEKRGQRSKDRGKVNSNEAIAIL